MFKLNERIANPKARQVYARIRRRGEISKMELVEQSGLTTSTLTRILDELCAASFIEESGQGISTGGRRPTLYRIRADYAYVFGLDITRSTSRLVCCNLDMEPLHSEVWSMSEQMTPDVFLEQVTDSINQLMKQLKIERSQVLGLGIGAVGPLDRHAGTIMKPLYFAAPGWEQLEICRYFEERLDIPVLLDNGANTGILAEYWSELPHDVEHMLYIRAGVGLRSSMMTNGRIVYGAVDMEGSVGKMIIQAGGVKHRDLKDSYGCLESYVSTYAMLQDAASKLKQGRSSVLRDLVDDPDELELSHLLQALEAGDSLVIEIFTQAATYFGIGVANLLNTLHPEKVVLGGPLISSSELFYQVTIDTALKHTYYYPDYQVDFSRGKLAESAVAVGAAVMVVNAMTD